MYPDGTSGVSTGGIFNLTFNTSGSLLAAACEAKTALLIDPSTRKTVIDLGPEAHAESGKKICLLVAGHFQVIVQMCFDIAVNCIRFLDDRVFATCSDDTTVALWDARYTKTRLRNFKGHDNCVKNIEYSQRY